MANMLDQTQTNVILTWVFHGGSAPVITPPFHVRIMTMQGSNTTNGTEATAVNCPGYSPGGLSLGNPAFGVADDGLVANLNTVTWNATGAWTIVRPATTASALRAKVRRNCYRSSQFRWRLENMAGETDRYRGNDADSRRWPDVTPEIELLKGIVGPRRAAVIKYIQDCRRRRQLYSDAVHEDSGLEPEEIALGGSLKASGCVICLWLARKQACARLRNSRSASWPGWWRRRSQTPLGLTPRRCGCRPSGR